MKIPWRVKTGLANWFPRKYYFVNNFFVHRNSEKHCDKFMRDNWHNAKFEWPTKNQLVASCFSKHDSIIDIGFGTGSLLTALNSRGFDNLWGLEQSDFALQQISKLNIQPVKGCLPKIKLDDNSFDGVIASEVLEHMLRRKFFLRELRRIMKSTGLCIITVPDNCMGPEEETAHTYKYTKETLRELLLKIFHVNEIYSIEDVNHEDASLVAIVSK